jgi:cobalt-zinc-cadmium efflux system protein
MSTTDIALTVHLVTPDASTNDALLSRINDELLRIFRIGHCTVQFERGDAAHPCGQASGDCV